MELIALGTGSAFTLPAVTGEHQNYQSNFLLEHKGKRLLIDAGGDIRFSLKETTGLTMNWIEELYISHCHGDHIGGLEGIALSTFFAPKAPKPILHINKSLIDFLWGSLKAGLSTVEAQIVNLDTFFDVRPIERNGSFEWEGADFQLVQTMHVYDGYSHMFSYGLMIEYNDKKIFLTTDTQFCPNQIDVFYDMADLIIHDCETSPYWSRVHAHYDQLKDLPEETKAKMFLHHYNPGTLPHAWEDGFRGFFPQAGKINLDNLEFLWPNWASDDEYWKKNIDHLKNSEGEEQEIVV